MSPPTQGITSKVEVGSQRTPKEDVALEKEIARVRRQMEEEKAKKENANGEDDPEDPYEYRTPFYPKPLYRRWEPGHQEWQPGHAGLSHLYRSPSDAPPPRPYHHTRLPRRPHAETLVEEGSNKATANPKLSRREARRIRKIHKRNPALKKYLSSSARVRAPGEEQPVRKPKTRFDRIVERFISRNWHPEVVQVLTQRGIDIKDFPTGDLTRKLNQDKGRLQWLIKRKFRKISRRLHQRFSSETSDTLGTELATLPRDRTVFPDLQYFKDSPDQRTPPRFCPQIPLPKERERGPAYDKHLNPAGVDLQIWLTTPEEAEDHYHRQQVYLAHRSASNNWLRIQGRKQIDDWLIGRAPPISQRRLNRVIEHHLARQPIPNLKDRLLQLEEVDIGIREPPRADNIVAWEEQYLANRIKPTFKKEVPSVRRNSSESEEDYFNLEECDITSAPRVRDSSPGKNLLSAPVPQEYPKSTKSAKPSPLRTVAFQADEPLVCKPSVPRSKPLITEAQSFRKYRQENPGLQGIIKDSIQSGKFFKRTKVKNQEPLRTAAILIETEVTQTFEPAPGYKSIQANPKPSAVKNIKSSGLLSLKKHSSKDLSSLTESENSGIQNSKEIDTQVTSKSKESSGIVDVPRAQHIENQNQLSLATPVISQAPTKHTASSKKTSPLQRPPPSLVSSFNFEEKLPSSATPTPDKRDPFATPDKDSPVLLKYRTALAQGAKVLCYEGRGQATPNKFDRPARRPNRVVADSPKASFESFEQPRVIHGVVVPRERLQARLQSLRHSKVLQPSDIVPSSLAANHTLEDALCSEESGKSVSPLDTRSLAEAKITGTYDEKELFERNYQRILEDRALYTIKTGPGVFGNIRDKKLVSLKLDSSPQGGDIKSNQKGERDFNGFQSQGLPPLPTTPELPPPNIPGKSPLRVQGVECVDFAKSSAKDCGLKSSIDSVSDSWAAPKPPPATFLAPPIIRVRPSRVHAKTKALGAYNQHLQLEQESFFNMDSSRLSARPAQYSSQRSQQVEDARQMQQSVFEAAKKAGKDPPKYTLLQLIGKGAFGRVYKGKDMETAAVVAIKTIDIDESDTLNPRQADAYGDFLKEVNALTALSEIKARNINHVIEALPVGKSMWMITEYCAGGSVSTLMNPTKPGGLQEKWIIPIVREVAEAIRWVHSVKIIHRDIKCGNVLVTEQGGVQLCDFGISSMLDSKLDKRKTVIGTPNWMAPELFDGRAIYGQDIDIWAFGAMIYEIATGLPPNAGLAFDDIGTTLKKSAPRLEGGNYSNELRDLVAFCLEEIPSARPDIEDVEKHPYIYNTASKYPTSSLTGLVRAYKMWEDHGGSRKSLFMAGGAQGPSEVNSNAFDGEWNFSTTAAFDQQVDRESNPQDVFDAYGTSVELDTSFAQRSTPQKGRRRPPPQALAPIKNPLERVFDQKTMSNYNDNSRERYGLDGNHQEQQYEFMGDLPLRNDTIQQPTRESLIDLGGYDAGMGISSFNDMDTIKASRRGRDEDIDDDYGETPSFNRPALSDPEQVGNNRRTQDWKFPSMAPPASADPEISRFPSSYNPPLPAMTPGSGGRPALIHHPTEPLGTAFSGVATSSALDRMSMSSLIDLDMSVPDPIDFSARPSTANSDVGSVTSELTSSRNPFEFEKHASRVPPQFDGADEANEPEIYVTDGGTHSRLQSGSSFRDMGDVSDFSASETEVPYRNGGHSRYVSEASDSDYMTMAPPPRPAAQQQGQSSYSVGHFPDLPLPPSAAALSGTASDREMAVEFHRMIDGLTGQLESFRDVYDELKPVTVARRPSQRRERDNDTA